VLKIIDSDDLLDAVVITTRTGLGPVIALEIVIKRNGRYWFADVRQLCAGCYAAVSKLTEPTDIAVICKNCRQYGERVNR
jgi:hypothetical protein